MRDIAMYEDGYCLFRRINFDNGEAREILDDAMGTIRIYNRAGRLIEVKYLRKR
jgi:hypothetical protein